MSWLDYAVLGVFAVSVAWGAWRGLVREIVSLLGWLVAFLAASLFAGPLAEQLPDSIPTPELRAVAAFLAIFVAALVVTTLLGIVLSHLVKAVGLGGLDRTLGGIFGVARGVIVLVALALLAGLTSAPAQPWWHESYSGRLLAAAAQALQPWLPPTLAERLRYH
ncbi:MAG: CvpA family protein [Betaproteobacteria bacterium]|nr:CvpA family protein [Betaproteobacteria bacterium]